MNETAENYPHKAFLSIVFGALWEYDTENDFLKEEPLMRPSFLALKRPILCSIIDAADAAKAIGAIRNDEMDGADAFAVNSALLSPESLEEDSARRLIRCTGKPMMFFSYRNHHLTGWTDEQRGQLQLRLAEHGAACLDVMGDYFDPSELEFTHDSAAIARQRQLIKDIHSVGAEVVISSHMPVARTAEQVLEQMSGMRDRGADIAKMITWVDKPSEFTEAVRTHELLNEKLGIPYIFLCNGRYAHLVRHMAPHLGSLLSFSVPRYDSLTAGAQPLTRNLRQTMDAITRRTPYPED